MTGDVLRRLREAYGFPADKVASRAGMTVAGFKTIERPFPLFLAGNRRVRLWFSGYFRMNRIPRYEPFRYW